MHPLSSPEAPKPAGTYSSGIAAGPFIFLAGQGPFNSSGERVGETFADQVRQTFRNLEAVAHAGGASLNDAVRYGVFLKSLDNFKEFNAVAAEFLQQPFPARTTIQADLMGFDVEIDAILYIASN